MSVKYLSSSVVDSLPCQAMVGCCVCPELTRSEPRRGVNGWRLTGSASSGSPASPGTSRRTTRPPPAGAARLQAGLPSVPGGALNITLLVQPLLSSGLGHHSNKESLHLNEN